MMVLMDLSSSSISGEVEVELLAEVVPVLGLVVVDEASLLLPLELELSEELSLEELLVESVSWPAAWDTGNTTEGSFVMVSFELSCGLAEREALGDGCTVGCASLWSGMPVTAC